MSDDIFSMTINGRAVLGSAKIDVVNPATGTVFAQAPDCRATELDDAVAAARAAFPAWAATPLAQRQNLVRQMGQLLFAHAGELKVTLTREQGKPLGDAASEVMAAGYWCVSLAAIDIPQVVLDDNPARRVEVNRVPLGVVGAIAPWNFPLALGFWKVAHAAGASIVDLTGTLEGLPGVQVRSPLVEGCIAPDLATIAELSAHPAAIMLSLIASRLRGAGLKRLAATVLQPASELGNAGVEELHQQTVSLLSFKPLQKDTYDAQVAFNQIASLGSAAKTNLERTRDTIHRQIGILAGEVAAHSVTLQLLQAPVFHGYTASVFLEISQELDEKALRALLFRDLSQLIDEESASNEMAAGKGEVLLRIAPADTKDGSAFWLWMAADNLRLAARNAAACALELLHIRPTSVVQ